MKLFRDLSPEEEISFRNWARQNYTVFSDISGVWHPVIQNECRKMNEQAFFADPNGAFKDFLKTGVKYDLR